MSSSIVPVTSSPQLLASPQESPSFCNTIIQKLKAIWERIKRILCCCFSTSQISAPVTVATSSVTNAITSTVNSTTEATAPVVPASISEISPSTTSADPATTQATSATTGASSSTRRPIGDGYNTQFPSELSSNIYYPPDTNFLGGRVHRALTQGKRGKNLNFNVDAAYAMMTNIYNALKAADVKTSIAFQVYTPPRRTQSELRFLVPKVDRVGELVEAGSRGKLKLGGIDGWELRTRYSLDQGDEGWEHYMYVFGN